MNEIENALISIRPNYAKSILDGIKKVELRRRVPSIDIGTRLWIYATRPQGEIVGSAIVESIIRGTPEEVWNMFMEDTGVSRSEFDSYFCGTTCALALVLSNVESCRPIGINRLRELFSGFHPPRVMTRLSDQETNWITIDAARA